MVLGTVALAAALLWAKIAAMLTLGVLAGASFADGEFVGGERYAEFSTIANIFEPHKALFNKGTLLAARGEFEAAVEPLEAALATGSSDDECDIRLNLALSLEQLSADLDRAGRTDDAETRESRARAVTSGASDSCLRDTLTDVADRLAARSDDAEPAEAPDPPQPQPGEEAEPEAPAAVDEIKGRMATGQSEYAGDAELEFGDTDDAVERPW